jgi:NTE family protein
VNSQAEAHHDWVKGSSAPSVIDVLSAVSSVGIYRYNFDTVELLRESAARWSREVKDHGDTMEARVVEVAFDHVADPEERAFLNNVATSFTLPDETIDRLIEVGGRLLRESSEYQAFVASFGGAVSAPDGP